MMNANDVANELGVSKGHAYKMIRRLNEELEASGYIGKVVSGAWKQFRNWWASQKQKNVEEKARASIQERLKEAKKQVDKEKGSKARRKRA